MFTAPTAIPIPIPNMMPCSRPVGPETEDRRRVLVLG